MATARTTLIILILALASCKTPQPPNVKIIGLWPEEPPLCYKPFDSWSGGDYYIWPRLDTAQPTFRWEIFPRTGDTNIVLAQVTNVSYDLRIWRNEGGFPARLEYARDSLTEPVHRIEQPLSRGQDYFWTVRARFLLNSQTRVTEWSRVESPLPLGIPAPTGSMIYPDARYYRFSTRNTRTY